MNLRDILNILDDFNSTVPSWRRILDKIDGAVQDYNAAIADPNEVDPAADLREWLPQYWQAVRAINTHQSGGEEHLPINAPYDVGIFLVGFSSLPIVLSIVEIQPRKEIYFIHSNDTREKCDEITNRFMEMLEDPPSDFSSLIELDAANDLITRVRSADRREIRTPSDPISTFQEIKDILDSVRGRLGNDARIALDLTGGKKTMIGGGFTAGSIYPVLPQCDMFYVDSLMYNQDRGAPKPGTEFLTELENPYDIYNVQSVGQAEELFYEHNYAAAVSLWDEVEEKLGDHANRYGLQDEQIRVQRYLAMARCYRLWDAFDYSEAQNHKEANGTLWNYNGKHVYNNRNDVLDILKEVQDKQTLFRHEYRVLHFAIDRYQNAVRRVASDKLEDAILRFTQVVEILCNYKIYQIARGRNLFDENGHEARNITPTKQWRNFKLIPFLFGINPSKGRNGDIVYTVTDRPQYERSGYERSRQRYYQFRHNADVCLNLNDYPPFTDISEIMELIECRNDFVHFNRPIGDEAGPITEKLKTLAYEFLRNFSEDYCRRINLTFNNLLKLHEFRQL